MWTCAWGLTPLTDFLIKQGADFQNHRSIEGANALMYASFYGRIDIVILLLENGANVNLKDISGCTAMDKAVLTENWKILKLLINSGGRYESLVPVDIDWDRVVPLDPEIQDRNSSIEQWLLSWENYYSNRSEHP